MYFILCILIHLYDKGALGSARPSKGSIAQKRIKSSCTELQQPGSEADHAFPSRANVMNDASMFTFSHAFHSVELNEAQRKCSLQSSKGLRWWQVYYTNTIFDIFHCLRYAKIYTAFASWICIHNHVRTSNITKHTALDRSDLLIAQEWCFFRYNASSRIYIYNDASRAIFWSRICDSCTQAQYLYRVVHRPYFDVLLLGKVRNKRALCDTAVVYGGSLR
jgi:hypothetical protein